MIAYVYKTLYMCSWLNFCIVEDEIDNNALTPWFMNLCIAGASLDSLVQVKGSLTRPMVSVWASMRILLWQIQTIIGYRCLRSLASLNTSLEYLVSSGKCLPSVVMFEIFSFYPPIFSGHVMFVGYFKCYAFSRQQFSSRTCISTLHIWFIVMIIQSCSEC